MKNVFENGNPKRKFIIFLFFLVILFLEYIAFKFCMVKANFKDENILNIFGILLENITTEPFKLEFTQEMKSLFLKAQIFVFGIVIFLIIYASTLTMKKGEFSGSEYGSASWAKDDELKKFRKNKDGIILGENLFMNHNSKEYNLNQFVIGGPGSGKTFRKIKPDVMQANTNFVITDSKGEIYRDTANYLRLKGYEVKVLNLIVPKFSMGFNPFKYLNDDKDVLILVDTFINNTEGDKQSQSTSNEGFWIKAETALLQSLIYYIWKELPEYEWNFNTALKLLLYASGDFSEKAASESLVILDKIFDELAKREPNHEAVSCYKIFRLSAGQTSTSIMIGLAVRFSIFINKDVEKLTMNDELELDLLANGDKKVALFIMISDAHRTFDVISAMFFSQLFQFLIYKADFEKQGSLDIHCRVLMDEFINIGFIPYFDTYLSTIRSRNISATIILQEITQLKTKYKDNWETIIGCCDTIIYLGSPANETREYLSKLLGKTTVQQNNRSMSFGGKGGRSESVNSVQRDLLTPDELRVIGDDKQVVVIRALKPIYIDKFKTEKRNYYKELNNKADYKEIKEKNKKSIEIDFSDLGVFDKVDLDISNEKEKIDFDDLEKIL